MEYTITLAKTEDLPDIVEIYNSTIEARQSTADLSPVGIETRKPWFEAHSGKRPLYVLKTIAANCWHGAASAIIIRATRFTSARKSVFMSDTICAGSAWVKSCCAICWSVRPPWVLKTFWP